MNQSWVDRFWAKVNKHGTVIRPELGPCWEWTAARFDSGYGMVGLNRKTSYTHRTSWVIHNGAIPDGLKVLHKCDNPPCVNPTHLFLGSAKDNTDDMNAKNRWVKPNHAKTACKNGHPFTADNLGAFRASQGQRECRTCARERANKWYYANGGAKGRQKRSAEATL